MKLLALDTATEACSAALWVDGVITSHCEIVGRDHTQRLLPVVAQVLGAAGLRYADLDGLVCGLGPGSFAGVRIGVAFAKGVALAQDLPVVGVSSLALLAQAALQPADAAPVLVAIDARMGEVYFQAFERGADGRAQPLGDAAVLPPQGVSLPVSRQRWQAVGTGWGSYEAVLRDRVPAPLAAVNGAALPEAAYAFAAAVPVFQQGAALAADALQPIYLRNNVALTLVQQQALRAQRG